MVPVGLRDLTAEELATVMRLAHSRTAPAHLVQRAQIIKLAAGGETASAIAVRVQLDGETVRKRIHRLNRERVEALKDRYRSGRPPTHSAAPGATVISTTLTKPQRLGLPFAAWPRDQNTLPNLPVHILCPMMWPAIAQIYSGIEPRQRF
ncbi:hypothetical protein MAE02_67700 [Microvirga aerophila]|uniref:Transposase n=1 Tax=Microvirga aerophila TaxID=670291 RepID=A0A512C4D8_9HYPH|nr:hypothetical protein MAE02_67700 [Microvirga aerophila]